MAKPSMENERAGPDSHAGTCARDRAGRCVGGATGEAAATKLRPIRPPSTPCAASSTSCRSDGDRGDRRGRARRSADALYRREGRHRRRPQKWTSRSIRLKCTTRLRQEPAEFAGRDGDGEKGAFSTRRMSTWTRSPSGRAILKSLVALSTSIADDNIKAVAEAKGVPGRQRCGLHPRSAASCRANRVRAQDGCRNPADRRRRRRRRDHTLAPEETGIDIYLGIGGAPEGVLAAAALRCMSAARCRAG
jgi:hypothetical protein